jgi:hypothetical protein
MNIGGIAIATAVKLGGPKGSKLLGDANISATAQHEPSKHATASF